MSRRNRKQEQFQLSLAVFLMILDGDKILLLRSNSSWLDGLYSFPGGILEETETIEEAVCRSAKEQLGSCIDVRQINLFHMMHNFVTGEKWIGAFFVCKDWQGKSKINELYKNSKLKWFSIHELPHNINPYVRQAISNYEIGKTHSLFGWEISAKSTEADYLKYYSDEKFTGY